MLVIFFIHSYYILTMLFAFLIIVHYFFQFVQYIFTLIHDEALIHY